MSEKKNDRLEFYLGQYVSLLTFAVFLTAVGILSITKAISMGGMAAYGVAGLILTSLFAKDHNKYWNSAMEGMLDPSTGILAMIFLVVGIFSKIMAAGKLAGGFVWVSQIVGLEGSLFCAFTFVVAAMIGLGTDTSVGTIITMLPIFLPAGVLMGADPVLMVGAILSGAALGDNLAPISDTTIISASSQKYTFKKGSADIGGVVASRAKYAIIAFVIAFILYLFFGGADTNATGAQDLLEKYIFPKGLYMIIPPLLVVFLAVKGRSIFTALTWGVVSGIIVGLVTQIFVWSDIMTIAQGKPKGIIVDGVVGTFENIVLFMVVMSMYGVLKKSGVINDIVKKLTTLANSPRKSEGIIMIITMMLSFLTAGITTMIVAIAGPLADSIGKPFKLHPYRRANLVDGFSNTWSYFIPWSAFLFIVLAIFPGIKEVYPFLELPAPSGFFFAVFYCWALWFVLVIAIITGYGRIFEDEVDEVDKG